MPLPLARACSPIRRTLPVAAALALTAGVAPAQTPAQPPMAPPGSAVVTWPVRTREHVDLWLHGLAMLMDDTARVPLFRRGYAADLRTARQRANVTTRLEAERDRLRARLAANPRLGLAAQFVPFAFDSWESISRAANLLVQTGGDPRRASDQQTAQALATLAASFPTAADREWLRVYVGALDDESTRFYHGYWTAAQTERAAARTSADSAWRAVLPKLQPFLTNTQQQGGELVLSLVLGGEGRTQNTSMKRNLIAVPFPATPGAALEPVYVAAHEMIGSIAGPVVEDNVTPAETRQGLADRYVSAAQVRGGLLLLQHVAPALADGYARYYLAAAGVPNAANPIATLATTFVLPQALVDALGRQIDITLGGI